MNVTDIIRDYYDQSVEIEWERIDNRPEFLITCRYIDRYVKAGDKVLDIGGGPGRYSIRLAKKGCDVTLFDLSPQNVSFARKKAAEMGLTLNALSGDVRTVDENIKGEFDCILLMGPLYHLLEESDRIKAINASLRLLKPGGVIFVSFINVFAGIIYTMKHEPESITNANAFEYYKAVLEDRNYAGEAFTQAFFIHQREVLPFMAQFPIEKLYYFGQESITSPCESNIMSQPQEIIDAWLDMAEALAELEHLLSWSEHLMYVGRKL